MNENEITVLKVEPGKAPEQVTIPNTLKAMQELVGGHIEIIDYQGACLTYPLNEDERGWLLQKMDAYCQQQMEMPLADVRKQWREEMKQMPSSPKAQGPELKMKGL